MDSLVQQITTSLRASSLPTPSQTWLASLISGRNPPPPIQALIATARARLLAADLTSPGLLDPTCYTTMAFPMPPAAAQQQQQGVAGPDVGVGNPQVKEMRLPRDVVVQVLDIENMSRSRWEQAEELDAVEHGEMTRGREVVRLPPSATGDGEAEGNDDTRGPPEEGTRTAGLGTTAAAGASVSGGKNATHRLLLQDCRGQKVFGLELRRIDRLDVGRTSIGEKLLISRGAVVARGTVLLEPGNCRVLGGKVDAWHKTWTDSRLARLKEGARSGGN